LHVPDFITSKQECCLKDALDESEDLFLSSGKKCYLIRIRNDLIPNYYLLAFPKTQGEPSSAEVREMLMFGIEQAQERAFEGRGGVRVAAIGTNQAVYLCNLKNASMIGSSQLSAIRNNCTRCGAINTST
jgi:hypothetical protein